jgi:hypothetical protein
MSEPPGHGSAYAGDVLPRNFVDIGEFQASRRFVMPRRPTQGGSRAAVVFSIAETSVALLFHPKQTEAIRNLTM